MRLERKWARVVIVLWGAACVPILLLTLAGLLGLRGGSIWLAVAALTVSIICVAAGLVLIFHKLLCPSCKKTWRHSTGIPTGGFTVSTAGTPSCLTTTLPTHAQQPKQERNHSLWPCTPSATCTWGSA